MKKPFIKTENAQPTGEKSHNSSISKMQKNFVRICEEDIGNNKLLFL